MKIPFSIPSLLTAVALSSFAQAEVKPNPLFSDGAVLQQNADVPVWGTANEGEKVTVEFDGQTASATSKDGKWMVHLKPHKSGGPFVLKIAGDNTLSINNILVGEVWVCSGQSNMEFQFYRAANAATERPLADYPKFRMFVTARKSSPLPATEVAGKWVECSPATVNGFSAVGYFFGRDLHKATGFPVGMIHSSVGGTPIQAWTSLAGFAREPRLQPYVDAANSLPAAKAAYPQELADYQVKLKAWEDEFGAGYKASLNVWTQENQKAKAEGKPAIPKPTPARPMPAAPRSPDGGSSPTALYNGMIAPLIPYAIKGVIWYQGEANHAQWREYRSLLPRLIADWRENWHQGEFPFLFVQIAPNNAINPELREAQLLTWAKTPNTAMTVTTDVGEATDIHPTRKEPVGARLALAARAVAYGEKIEYSGPVFDSVKIDQNRAVLSFKHLGGGLFAKDGALKGFTIAGTDKKFVPAKADILGETVVVSAAEVPQPLAVRYGWANVPDVNLYNKEGLPASPFRTDVE